MKTRAQENLQVLNLYYIKNKESSGKFILLNHGGNLKYIRTKNNFEFSRLEHNNIFYKVTEILDYR